MRRSLLVALATGSIVVGCTSSNNEASEATVTPPATAHPAPTTTPPGDCEPASRPLGALPTQPPPIFCSIANHGPGTEIVGANSWVDDFDHGLSFADFTGTGYRIFENGGFVGETRHWRHADHWMVDVAAPPDHPLGWNEGMAMMRPDRSFRFEDGMLVVEAVVAAGVEEYGGPVWPEILVSTGAAPHYEMHGNYGYEKFPEDWTLGCRLQSSGWPICALKSNDGDTQTNRYSNRVYEISPGLESGSTSYYQPWDAGGAPNPHRFCAATDPDMHCRDLFRLELSDSSLTLFVNDVKYFEQTGLPPFPVADEDLYVYFPSVVVGMQAEAARFHWDRVAINP
jgi:hypothetical protein